ncbi:MAG TPA: hypothetical protein VMT34_12910 [Aggregatilineales bacterium]|nr:hypothetical protein [Aggregatilineales bacterium]
MTVKEPSATRVEPDGRRGVPLWQPIAALLLALVCAIAIGVRVLPTLAPLVFPPAAPLPAGVTDTPILHENKGWGLDEFVYATNQDACTVVTYYQNRIGGCNFDAGSNCKGAGMDQSGREHNVGRCIGEDTIGTYQVTWTAYVATGYTTDGQTRIRIVREISGGERTN